MKKFIPLAMLLAGVISVSAAPDDAQVFRSTTRYVDMDGTGLSYFNTGELMKMTASLPGFFSRITKQLSGNDMYAKVAYDGTGIVLKTLNLNACLASASSLKNLPGGLQIGKGFIYTGKNGSMPGIFSRFNFQNDLETAKVLSSLPSDVLFAMKIKAAPGELFNNLNRNVKASGNEMINGSFSMFLTFAAQSGVDINQVMQSINGDYLFLIAGKDQATLRIMLVIPDTTGAVANILKTRMAKLQDPARSGVYKLKIPKARKFGWQPAAVIRNKEIVLINDIARLDINTPAFVPPAEYLRLLPSKGCNFSVINLSREQIAALRKLPEKQAKFIKGYDFKPFLAISVGEYAPDGFRETMISDFSWFSAGFNIGKLFSTLQNNL